MKDPGFRCKGSHVGYPHGRDKHRERAKKVAAQQAAKAAAIIERVTVAVATAAKIPVAYFRPPTSSG